MPRISDVVDEIYGLFLDLDATEQQIEFPIVYTNAKQGWAALEQGALGTDLKPLFELIVDRIPAPTFDPEHPLQAWVTNLDASQYLGRLALCRIFNGTIKRGQTVAWCRAGGTIERVKISELYVSEALDRVAGRRGRPGRDHRRRRHRRDQYRRDARRCRRSTAAAGDHRRRAELVDDHRHQHLAALGA